MSDSTEAGRSGDDTTTTVSVPTDTTGAPPDASAQDSAPEAAISSPTGSSGIAGGGKRPVRVGDRVFRTLTSGSGIFMIVLIGAIGLFLLLRAIPALSVDQVNFLFSREWETSDPANMRFGILDLLWVTVASSLVALVLAMPVACGIALFLTHYAPRSLARPFAYIVDLLAAVPSVIFGLWGIQVLAPALRPVSNWLNANLGFIPIFADGNIPTASGANIFTAGIVLAVMILPIITGVTREVFGRTPTAHIEGALALGATKWEVVRTTVWPFGKAGFVSGSMLGLGRALGETVALTTILSSANSAPEYSVFDGGATFASKIALGASEFNDNVTVGAYISAGLVLFLITFAVNALARSIIGEGKDKS